MDTLVLASRSPQRREILRTLNIPYIVFAVSVDEGIPCENNRRVIPAVINLSKKKVRAAAGHFSNGLVLGIDTVVYFQRTVLGKPGNEDEARKYLTMLNGNRHAVISGITIFNVAEGRGYSSYSVTDVYFQKLSRNRVEGYVDQGEWTGKAGGYAIQGKGALFVEKIVGSFYNVVGLPVEELNRLLDRFNYFESEGLYRPIKIV
jgi:septum formation protein